MDLRGELGALKRRAMAAIEHAAKEGDARQIMVLSAVLAEIERDERTAITLEDAIPGYGSRLDAPQGVLTVAQPTQPVEAAIDRERRKDPAATSRARKQYQDRLSLKPEKAGGAICRTPSGKRVGIGAASERKPNRWFSGVQDTELDYVVLFCLTNNGEELDFVLPMTFLSNVWPHLSRDSRIGPLQVKFNVSKRNGTYELEVPGRGPVDIGAFLGQRGPLA